MQVHLQNIEVKFVYQGHWVKVKVTGAKSVSVCALWALQTLFLCLRHCWKNGAGDILYSGLSARLRTLWRLKLKKKWREFHPVFLVANVFGFTDVLIRFWGQRSRSHRAVIRKPGEYNSFVTIGANFTKIRSHMYLDLGHNDYVWGSKGQRSRSRQGEA